MLNVSPERGLTSVASIERDISEVNAISFRRYTSYFHTCIHVDFLSVWPDGIRSFSDDKCGEFGNVAYIQDYNNIDLRNDPALSLLLFPDILIPFL